MVDPTKTDQFIELIRQYLAISPGLESELEPGSEPGSEPQFISD
jgi:hypothetical protein